MRASAAKRGRDPRYPYVPVVVVESGRTHNTNTRNTYATRDEAVAHAQRWIEAHEALSAQQAAARAKRHGEG